MSPILSMAALAHPAIETIAGGIGALLVNGGSGSVVGIAQLVPADAVDAARVDCMVYDEQLVIAEVAIGKAEHEPVGEVINASSGTRLRNDWGALGSKSATEMKKGPV